METESIMIVVDNTHYVPKDSHTYKTQFEAIRLYCRAKFKSNPKTRVGLATLGWGANLWPPSPDSDIEHFLTDILEHIPWGGEYSILMGLRRSPLGFARNCPEDEDIKRRMLVFVAGPCHGYLTDHILKIGKGLKEKNIALDVVSFPHQDQEFDALKTISLRSFVAAADNNNNSHFARLPLHSSVIEILVSSKILSLSQAEGVPFMEEEIKKMKLSIKNKKKKLRRNRSKKKNHHSQEDPQEEPHVSSSPPPVILPANFQVPQKYKYQNQLVFGSWEMDHLEKIYHQFPENYKKQFVFGSFQV